MTSMKRAFRNRGWPWWAWRRIANRLGRYDPAAEALFARFTAEPTDKRKRLISLTIDKLKAAGLWSKLDALYLIGADAQASQRNWIADAYNLTEVSTPTFVADSHYVGNGVDQRLDTGFNPTTAVSPKFTQNDAHMGLWSLTDLPNGAGASFDIGNTNSFISRSATVAGRLVARANIGSSANVNSAYPGHVVWVRATSTTGDYYSNGVDIGNVAGTTAALTNLNFFILSGGGSSWGVNETAAAHWGSKLTAAQAKAMHTIIRAYLLAIGAV